MSKRERDAEVEQLQEKVKELEGALNWAEKKMRQQQNDLDAAYSQLSKFRRETWVMSAENDTLRQKVRGALVALMGDFEDNDE